MTEATLDDGARRRTEALQAARQRDSHTKRAHVRSTIEKMLLAGDPVTFTTVARTARVSTWLVYADGVREHIQAAIRQQADQPADHAADDPASMVSLRTDLALARDEITRLRAHNDKLRLNAQRLLGRQLDQIDQGELLARVDALAAENRRLTEKLQQSAQEKSVLAHRNIELEEDIAAARTALRRMIKEQSSGV